MFGSKKTETVTSATPAAPKSTSTASSSSALNSIVSGTKIEGKVQDVYKRQLVYSKAI